MITTQITIPDSDTRGTVQPHQNARYLSFPQFFDDPLLVGDMNIFFDPAAVLDSSSFIF